MSQVPEFKAFETSQTAELRAKLVKAGFSAPATEGFIAIGSLYTKDWMAAGADKAALLKVLEKEKEDLDVYFKTQSEADQAVYPVFMKECKTNIENF